MPNSSPGLVPSILFASAVALTACLGTGERSRSRVPSSIHVPNLAMAAVSPRGSLVATASMPAAKSGYRKATLAIWNTADGTTRFVKDVYRANIRTMQLSPADKFIGLTGEDKPNKWYMSSRPPRESLVVKLLNARTGAELKRQYFESADAWCVARFIDSNTYIFAVNKKIHTWHVQSGEVTEEAVTEVPYADGDSRVLDISRNGERVLIAYYSPPLELFPADKKRPYHALAVADIKTGKIIGFIASEFVISAGFSRDGTWFYLTEDRSAGKLALWDIFARAFETENVKQLWDQHIRVADEIEAKPRRDSSCLQVATTKYDDKDVAQRIVHTSLDSRTGLPLPASAPYSAPFESGFAYSRQPAPIFADGGSVMITKDKNEVSIWNRDDDQCKWDSC